MRARWEWKELISQGRDDFCIQDGVQWRHVKVIKEVKTLYEVAWCSESVVLKFISTIIFLLTTSGYYFSICVCVIPFYSSSFIAHLFEVRMVLEWFYSQRKVRKKYVTKISYTDISLWWCNNHLKSAIDNFLWKITFINGRLANGQFIYQCKCTITSTKIHPKHLYCNSIQAFKLY